MKPEESRNRQPIRAAGRYGAAAGGFDSRDNSGVEAAKGA